MISDDYDNSIINYVDDDDDKFFSLSIFLY